MFRGSFQDMDSPLRAELLSAERVTRTEVILVRAITFLVWVLFNLFGTAPVFVARIRTWLPAGVQEGSTIF